MASSASPKAVGVVRTASWVTDKGTVSRRRLDRCTEVVPPLQPFDDTSPDHRLPEIGRYVSQRLGDPDGKRGRREHV